MALPAKTGAAGGSAESAEIQMAPDALLMKGFLPIESMPVIMAGCTFDMRVAGIEFHGIQDIILIFVINMVAVQTAKFRHVHIMRKGDGISMGRAVFLLHRAGVQYGKGKDPAQDKHNQYAA
jgi:hypothetical protein